MVFLKRIELEDKEIVLDYIRELVAFGSETDGIWHTEAKDYETMVQLLHAHETVVFKDYDQEDTIKYQFLLIRKSDNQLLGVVSVRPFMTRRLDDSFGGSIGYSIRPTERRKGYASQGLKLAIDKTRELNPKGDVIVCCNRDNIGSRKAIINNGGVLIDVKEAVIVAEKYCIK